MAPKIKKPSRSPPAEKSSETATRPPFRPARSRSPPVRRVSGKTPEDVAPAPAAVENTPAPVATKPEVKLEVIPEDPAGSAAALASTEAVTLAGSEVTAYAAPPHGEMQRMLSNLKVQAKNGNATPLQAYGYLSEIQEKRKYYYECWLTANPKTTDSGGVRSRKSEKLDEAVVKDHGWVDKEYVAEKLCLKDWKTSEEADIKLKFHLSRLERRSHPAQHLLKDNMDPFQYHFVEHKDKETQRNKRSFELLQQTAMSQEEHEAALNTWDTGAGSSRALPPPKRVPSRSPPQEAAPQWLGTFKKEGVNNLTSLKRSMTVLLSNAETLVKTCDDNPGLFKNSQLLQAYLETVRTQIKSLKVAEQKAATFELKHSKSPQNKEEAEAMLPKFKAAAEEAKAVKTAFSSSTSAMQAALRSKLAQLTHADAD